jgi:hypothetical protein
LIAASWEAANTRKFKCLFPDPLTHAKATDQLSPCAVRSLRTLATGVCADHHSSRERWEELQANCTPSAGFQRRSGPKLGTQVYRQQASAARCEIHSGSRTPATGVGDHPCSPTIDSVVDAATAMRRRNMTKAFTLQRYRKAVDAVLLQVHLQAPSSIASPPTSL